MALFLVSYDLIAGKDYDRIIQELERLGAVRTQFSTYFANVTSNTSQEFLQHLNRFVDGDDRLMVVKLTERPRYNRAFVGSNEWLDRNFP